MFVKVPIKKTKEKMIYLKINLNKSEREQKQAGLSVLQELEEADQQAQCECEERKFGKGQYHWESSIPQIPWQENQAATAL